MYDQSELKFAMIGAGYYASMQVPAWSEVSGARPVAVYNRTISKAKELAEKYGIPSVYDDAERMFRNEKLDFVDIITHPATHAQFVYLAAKYKVPVICQKPMAPDYETCKAMVSVCRDGGVPFMIHENFRWQPANRGVRQILDEGLIGRPYRAHIQLSMGGAETFITEPGLMALENPGLYDMGPHLFDLARFFFGEPQSVYCQTYRSFGYLKGENIVCSLLRFGDLSCVCEISDIVPYNVFVEGEEGSLVLGTDDSVAITTKKGTDVRRYPSPHYPWVSEYDEKKHGIGCINGIVQCNASLFNAIRTGQPAETSAEESLKTMRIVNAALDSSKCVKVIKMDLSVCSLQKQMC